MMQKGNELECWAIGAYKEGVSLETIAHMLGLTIGATAKFLASHNKFSSQPETKVLKTRATKAELVDRLANVLNISRDSIEGIEKAKHAEIEIILERVKEILSCNNR